MKLPSREIKISLIMFVVQVIIILITTIFTQTYDIKINLIDKNKSQYEQK